ncbi:discoidin domain-containing protein [Celerinatantimonas yamalensis]|uniref:Discoidin domain-containing protein n=1 Tax=Celerinatantimonas yamalensis TaxID=559956 RepID=A0ABW9G5M5_9GAMM
MKHKLLNISVAALVLCTSSAFAAKIKNISASGYDQGNGHTVAQIADGKSETRWAIPSSGWVEFELEKTSELHNFFIIPFKGDQRKLGFEVHYSQDNKVWTSLTNVRKQTDLDAKKGEIFTFPSIKAKYVKFNVYGTDVNHWSAINEIQFNSILKVKHHAL